MAIDSSRSAHVMCFRGFVSDVLSCRRCSWLEEINRRQAEAVAARVSAEKLRLRDQNITAENDRFRVQRPFRFHSFLKLNVVEN